MSLASIIAKQVVKASGDLFKDTDVQKAISAQVDDVMASEALQGKDGQDYLVKMTKAMLNDDPNFKPDVDRDPNLGLYLEVEHKLFSGNPDMREAYHAVKINNAKLPSRNVMPAPQRFFDPEDKAFKPFLGGMGEQPGGRYLEMGAEGPKDITGEFPQRALIGVTPEGKPVMQVSKALLEGETRTDGRKIKTNLFKKKAGWKWTQVPKGFDPEPPSSFPLVSVEDGKQHYYTLQTEFPEGVELTRYEKSKSEPRLRPTKKGNVYLGNKVGEISVRGKKHPVYDKIEVYGLVGASTAGMLEYEDYKNLFTERMASAEGGEVIREVKSGDTLSKISQETGVSVEDLISLNDIKDPNNIQVGQTLRFEPPPNKIQSFMSDLGQSISDAKDRLVAEALPINIRAFLGDLVGDDSKITEKNLSSEERGALREIVLRNQSKNKPIIEYGDYNTDLEKYKDVSGFASNADVVSKTASSPEYALKTTLGQARITTDEDGNTLVVDRYNFNDARDDFKFNEFIKDVVNAGLSGYAQARNLGRYFGSGPSEGAEVVINLGKLNPKERKTLAMITGTEGRTRSAKGGKIDKKKMKCNKPKRTPSHPKKSHVVKACKDGKEKIIRFGEQGAKTAGKPKAGESKRMKAKRKSFKARHRKNIKRGNMSAAYWADKVKW